MREIESTERVPQNRSRWPRIVKAVVFVSGFVFVVVCLIEWRQVSRLKQAASTIRRGDTVDEVVALLGPAWYSFHSTGHPPGTEPETTGFMYGGTASDCRSVLDSAVRTIFGGMPGWYTNMFSLSIDGFAVVVEFDRDKRVQSVSIRGVFR